MEIKPQEGPQTAFLSTEADIAIYGGAAGGGKSWALLAEPIRHIKNPKFGAVIFRRTTTQIRNEGSLWDESNNVYPFMGGKPKEMTLEWKFPSGASVSMSHLEHEKSVSNYQGSQIALELFDELTHFSEAQFFYMLSRNRSTCGIRPYVRATCNPDADSWVATFIEWWIDQETGYAIPERSGKIRYFVRVGSKIIWADQPEELSQYKMLNGDGEMIPIPPKSVTFISSKLTDNKVLMEADPGYMANLMSLPLVERERLLGGNWKIRPSAGLYFQRDWVKPIDIAPHDMVKVRAWDLAATPLDGTNDPDGTSSVKMGKTPDGKIIVLDCTLDHLSPKGVEGKVIQLADDDGYETAVDIAQDPGQAGKAQIQSYAGLLSGYEIRTSPETGDKITRFSPFSAQAEAGNVYVVRGPWNELWFNYLEGFPEMKHDDPVDATSRAYNRLTTKRAKARLFLRTKNG